MADFTGMTVKVTLKQPPNTIVHGRVKEIVAGQSLALEDMVFPSSGTRWPSWTVQGTAIADLEVIGGPNASAPAPMPMPAQVPLPAPPMAAPKPTPTFQAPPPTAMPTQVPAPPRPVPKPMPTFQALPLPIATKPLQPPVEASQAPTPQPATAKFVDPAILSFGRSPVQPREGAPRNDSPATPVRSTLAKAAETLPAGNTSPYVSEPPPKFNVAQRAVALKEVKARVQRDEAAARPAEMLQAVDENEVAAQGDGVEGEISGKKKRNRNRTGKKTAAAAKSEDPPPVMNSEVSRNGNDMNGSVRRGKGWRQDPLLQPSPQHSATASTGSGRKGRRHQREQRDTQNGWATEDATDIQDLPDFDFEANHKLFDKKGVFDQLRQDDTTADEDRLVGHNRLERPGTYGGKNLHPTENVLSPKLAPESDSSDADTEMNLNTGRSSSRHSVTKRQPSRQSSTMVEGRHPLASSMSSDRGLARSVASLATKGGKPLPASLAQAAHKGERVHSPKSAVSSKGRASPRPSFALPVPHFAITSSLKTCPVLHPDALDTLETAATVQYGLSPDAFTESAARSIAELALSMFETDSTSRRGSRANTLRGSMSNSTNLRSTGLPVIVILAGKHSAGARAVAAARQLMCRRTRIILAEAQFESASVQDEQLAKQIRSLKKLQAKGMDVKRGPWRKAFNYIKNLSGPPAVIIDALLAGETYDSLETADVESTTTVQKETREMIEWANRSRAPVLSIACPSGVSGLDGSATVIEGEPLAVRPERVLALGLPLQGILEAVKGGERWEVSLADVGVNVALKVEEAVDFGREWVTGLRYLEEDG